RRGSSPAPSAGDCVARFTALGSSFFTIEGPLLVAGAFEARRRFQWYFWFVVLGLLFAGPVFVAYANMDLRKDRALWGAAGFFPVVPCCGRTADCPRCRDACPIRGQRRRTDSHSTAVRCRWNWCACRHRSACCPRLSSN